MTNNMLLEQNNKSFNNRNSFTPLVLRLIDRNKGNLFFKKLFFVNSTICVTNKMDCERYIDLLDASESFYML